MLAIAGGKGGSGKTTTTLGLAAALDGGVLVVAADVDVPNLHRMAGVDPTPTLADAGSVGVEAAAQPHPEHPSVSVLPAPTAAGAAPTPASPPAPSPSPDPGVGDGSGVESALAGLDRPDATLVDCPAGAGPDAAAALRAADATLLVSSLCRPALRDTAKTAAMARTLGAAPVGVVLTRSRLTPDPVAELLGCPALASVPAVDPPVLGTPVVRAAYERLAAGIERETDLYDGVSNSHA
jgi:septum site-determining protein MinD